MLAEKYGRSPEEVENWPVYWMNRAITGLELEAEQHRRFEQKIKRNQKR